MTRLRTAAERRVSARVPRHGGICVQFLWRNRGTLGTSARLKWSREVKTGFRQIMH